MLEQIAEHLEIWSAAQAPVANGGRGRGRGANGQSPHGIKKLRELILELAVRGKLVEQDPLDEPASVLLEKIAKEKARLVKEGKIKKQKPLPKIGDDEKPFELPKRWEWVRLGIALKKITDGTHHSPPNGESGDFLYISAKNIKDDGVLLGNATYVSKVVHEEIYSRCDPEQGDVLYIKDGATTGIATINNLKEPFSMLSSVALLKLPKWLLNSYLLLSLRAPYFYEEMRAGMTGVAITRVTLNKLNDAIISLPPLAEQQHIVAKVDELMALCDTLEQQQTDSNKTHQTLVETLLATLTASTDQAEFTLSWQRIAAHFDTLFTTEESIDQLKQTILQLAVTGKLVHQDPNDEPASTLLEKIAKEKARLIKEGKIKKQKPLPKITDDEKPFELPDGWEWIRIGNAYRFLNGYAFKSDWFQNDGIRLLRNINILHGETRWQEVAHINEEMSKEFSEYQLELGDIILSLDRPIINSGLKYAVISNNDLPCLLLQRVAKFHSYKDVITPSYLTRWLESDYFISSIDPGRSNGVPHISTKQISNLVFALPPLAEQHRIVTKVNELMALCDILKARLHEAQTTQIQLADAIVEQAVAA